MRFSPNVASCSCDIAVRSVAGRSNMTRLLALKSREEQYPPVRAPWLCCGSHSRRYCSAERLQALAMLGFGCVPNHTAGRKTCARARTSVHTDGFELLAPGIGDGRLAAVGQHDRRAVG